MSFPSPLSSLREAVRAVTYTVGAGEYPWFTPQFSRSPIQYQYPSPPMPPKGVDCGPLDKITLFIIRTIRDFFPESYVQSTVSIAPEDLAGVFKKYFAASFAEVRRHNTCYSIILTSNGSTWTSRLARGNIPDRWISNW